MTATKGRKPDAAAVKTAAAGRWIEILQAAGIDAKLLDGKGHPCPKCGGKDRFYAQKDVAQRGAVNCRQCFPKCGGDGLATIAWFKACDFPEALQFVADFLNISPTGNGRPQEQAQEKQRRIVSTYNYRDAHGELIYQAVRYEPKDFRQRRPKAGGGWEWKTAGIEPLPYRLPELLAADSSRPVVVTEGEKDADNLARLGFVTTTNHGGAGNWTAAHAKHLAGRRVVILPDNDSPGEQHARTVASSLQGIAARVAVLRLPDLPDKGDVSDWLEAGNTPRDLEELIDAAPEWTAETAPSPATPKVAAPVVIDWRPYPVDALPDPLRSFVAAGAESIGCDPSYLALPLLTAAGAAIGTTRRLVLKRGWAVCPILWCAIVGESGTSKTPAFRLVTRPVRERQRTAMDDHAEMMRDHEIELARYERDHAKWKRDKGDSDPPQRPECPEMVRYIVSDTTVEALAPILLANPRGVLLARDELAGWLGSFDRYSSKGGGDSAHWLSMYSAESIVVDRKTGTPRTIYVPSAAVAICGGIQPGILHRALGSEHRESGLAARLLLTCPPRRPKRWTEADIDETTERLISELLTKLYALQPDLAEDGQPRPRAIGMNATAKAVWLEHYAQHAEEQADLCGDLAAAWSKLEETPARLALILHYATWQPGDTDQVAGETMRRAVILTDWHKHETRRVYAQLGESEESAELRRLAEWIGRRGGALTARELQQGRRDIQTADAAENLLDALVKAGYGAWQDSPKTSKGGRPTRVFLLSTLSTSTKPPESKEMKGFVDVDSVDVPKSDAKDRFSDAKRARVII